MPGHFAVFGPAENGVYSQAFTTGNFYLAFKSRADLENGHNIVKRLEELILESDNISPEEIIRAIPDIEIAAARTSGEILDVAATAGMKVKLLRAGRTISLLPQPGKISGNIKNGDRLILGTDDFFANLFSPELVENRDELTLKLESLGNKAGVAALVLKIEGLGEESQEPTEIIKPSPKRTLYAAGVILIFLISLLAFQLRSRGLEQQTKTSLALEKQAQESLENAKKLAGLNDNLARETLTQAKTSLLTGIKDNGLDQNKFSGTLQTIDDQLGIVSHIYQVTPTIFSDFNLLRAQANVTAATLNKNTIMVLDTANGAVYSLGTKNKAAAIVAGVDDFKQSGFLDFNGETAYVYTGSGIYNNTKNLLKLSDQFQNIKGLKFFAGNIYLLDIGANQIWKYQGTDFGFASPSAYLRTGSADFANVTSFAVDGTIFVLSTTGNVANFSGGYGQDFSVTGLDKPFNNPKSIFTSDEAQNLYILDAGRVVVLDKKGNYQAQYVSPEITGNLLLADETVKKVFLFSGSKVYSFDLR